MAPVDLGIHRALSLRLELVEGARSVPPIATDLSVAPGLEVAEVRAWRGEAERVDLVCAAGPAFGWVSGFQRPIFDAASAMVRRHTSVPRLTIGEIVGGPPFEQRYRGEALAGRHWLGFTGGELVVCSLACRGEPSACAPWLEGAHLVGSDPAVPEPGPLLRIAVAAAEHRQMTVVGALVVSLLFAAIVLWRRPRPDRSVGGGRRNLSAASPTPPPSRRA